MEWLSKWIDEITPTVHQIACIDPAQIPFSQEVVDACEKNYCGRYGKTWTCPPGVGHYEERRALCLSYKQAVVFTTTYPLEDSFDIEGMHRANELHEQVTDRVIASLPEAAKGNYLAFSAHGCHICEKCTYPDAPCRFPDRARVSVEANGIYVVGLAQKCDINYHNGTNTVTYFSMLLLR